MQHHCSSVRRSIYWECVDHFPFYNIIESFWMFGITTIIRDPHSLSSSHFVIHGTWDRDPILLRLLVEYI